MKWELERHNWAGIGVNLIEMPNVIDRLLRATDRAEAERMYWRIDSVVVRNGGLLPGAPEVCECLVQGLVSATPVSREKVLELLVQIGGGEAGDTTAGTVLSEGVRHQVLFGLPIYAEFLETGSRAERFHCIDLLSICAEIDINSRSRVRYLLLRAAEFGEREQDLVKSIFDFLHL